MEARAEIGESGDDCVNSFHLVLIQDGRAPSIGGRHRARVRAARTQNGAIDARRVGSESTHDLRGGALSGWDPPRTNRLGTAHEVKGSRSSAVVAAWDVARGLRPQIQISAGHHQERSTQRGRLRRTLSQSAAKSREPAGTLPKVNRDIPLPLDLGSFRVWRSDAPSLSKEPVADLSAIGVTLMMVSGSERAG